MQELQSTSAIDNYIWAMDTVNKYNACAIKKEGVTKAYDVLVNKLNQYK